VRIVYAAEAPAICLLEALVRMPGRDRLPQDYQLLQIALPGETEITTYEGDLPTVAQSQAWGSEWLVAGKTLLAKVPSAIAPYSFNILINPAHPDAAGVRLIGAQRWDWDERLAR
jgi:RES domain-containing protein